MAVPDLWLDALDLEPERDLDLDLGDCDRDLDRRALGLCDL